MSQTIVVAAALAQRPGRGGHAWVILQYLLGFKRLGYDVVFVDNLDAGMATDQNGQACSMETSRQHVYMRDVLRRFGLEKNYALLHDDSRQCLGLSREQLAERLSKSAMLLNVMGYLKG